MKKQVLYIVLMLFLVCNVSALRDKIIFDGIVSSGDAIDVENQTYRVIFIRDSNNTVFYFPNGLSAVVYNNETCAREWLYSVCRFGVKYMKGDLEVPSDINDFNLDYRIDVLINYSDIDLTIEHTYDKTDWYFGDKINVESILRKKGTIAVSNISYTEEFNGQVDISNVRGCSKIGNTLVWKGDLNTSSIHRCTYTLQPQQTANITRVVNLGFELLKRNEFKTTTIINTVARRPLLFNVVWQTQPTLVETLYSVNLSLESLEEIQGISVEVNYPDSVKANDTSVTLEMNKNAKKTVPFLFTSRLEQNSTGEVRVRYTHNGNIYDEKMHFPLTFYNVLFNASIVELSDKTVLRITNPTIYPFKDIVLKGENFSASVEALDAKRFKEIELSTIPQSINITYRTQQGQILTKNMQLVAAPVPDDIKEETTPQPQKEESKPIIAKQWIIGILAVYLVIGVVAGIVILFKSHSSKSNLDKEIEELKKKEL